MAENKLIIGSLPVLRGEYDSATNYYRDNQVTMYGSTFQSLADDNVGYPPAELRKDGKVYAINTDKWIIVANAIDAYNAGERIANAETRIKELGEYGDSPEFIRVYTDAEGKFLWGIRVDGSVEWAKGVPTPVQNAIRELKDKLETQDIKSLQDAIDVINASLKPLTDTFSYQDNPEFLNVVTDRDGKVVEATKPDGTKYFPKQEMLEKYDDPEERTEITTDAENRVLAYRDKNGIKHEEKLALHEVYDKDNNKINLATKEDVENVTIDPSDINIADLDGVSNHNTPNLLIASEMQKTFNDGTNSFTPPNEGYEMSNPIECQAGDWFTRTGTATGMVVVTDENDKNGTRLFNADGTTLGNTFQIPEDMDWVRYIRIAAERTGAENGSVVICKGKVAYTADERGDYITVDKLKCHRNNMGDDILYIQSPNGKYWEIKVSDDGVISASEIDPEVISPSDLPSDLPTIHYNGSFEGLFDRFTIMTNKYMYDMKNTGIVCIHNFGKTNFMYANFEHVYNSKGEGRYVIAIRGNTPADTFGYFGVVIFDEDFNVITDYSPNGCLTMNNVGTFGAVSDYHDFKYIDDNDILIFTAETNSVNDCPGKGDNFTITYNLIQEIKDGKVYTFSTRNYPKLYTDYANETPSDPHMNTLELDYDGNILANFRNCESWVKIRRIVKEDGSVVIGSETNDYDEAIIGRVGGRRNGYYLDSKRVLPDSFSFTDTPTGYNVSTDEIEEWQFNHCHDVKYWGIKQIGDKQYPTYTLFDNNYPISTNIHYDDSDKFSRIVQLSIDWDNLKIMDYKIYQIKGKGYYSQTRGGATMYDEGKLSIAWANIGKWGVYDFTTEENTNTSGKILTGAKILFEACYDNYSGDGNGLYRANTYKLKK